jgi:hypothetical protein
MLSLSSVYLRAFGPVHFSKPQKKLSLAAVFYSSGVSNFSKLQEAQLVKKFSATHNQSIRVKIEHEITKLYPEHPFVLGISQSNVQDVMWKYLAMSQAFPLIQSGAFLPLIKKSIVNNKELPEEFFKAFAVAMFLCNDEMGSHHILSNGGNRRLPEILKTEEQSHASLLKKDLLILFGNPPVPNFCPVTKQYLLTLSESLGSNDIVELVASMVAFETHANHMINAVWQRIGQLFPAIDKNSLEYFKIHVGGDDPAEAYHVQMTDRLIIEAKAESNSDEFVKKVLRYYDLNATWCQNICQNTSTSAKTIQVVE